MTTARSVEQWWKMVAEDGAVIGGRLLSDKNPSVEQIAINVVAARTGNGILARKRVKTIWVDLYIHCHVCHLASTSCAKILEADRLNVHSAVI
jgi:hypothetical protein